jgi:anti-sigma B factor antagonist
MSLQPPSPPGPDPQVVRTGLAVTAESLDDTTVVVHAAGQIDLRTVGILETMADGRLAEGRTRLVLDLSEVTLCDSSGLSAMIRIHHRAGAAGGWLRLVAAQPQVQRVLELTNLVRLVPLHPGVQEALDGT